MQFEILNQRSSIWILAFFACALAVLVLALMPSPPQELSSGWDKSNHLLAFAVLTWLGGKAFPQRLAITLLGLLAYGALIEVLQSFTPTRSAEWLDLVADGMGILVGWALYSFKCNRSNKCLQPVERVKPPV